ncbi:Exosome complex component MTR3 [Blattella germanica]|nr:Exosome complex component MTR3 [Blattella germanica]
MPGDSRRIQGPENTTPYSLYVKSKSASKNTIKEIINKGIRKDGRNFNEQRRIYIKTGVISQAKGSAYIEQNNTKVICSAFDPREIPRKSDYSLNGELYCEFKFAPFSCSKWKGHQPDAYEKECGLMLRRALEPAVCRHEFPNFQVDVYALVLENDGSALAAAITCAGLALADASVPMYDLVVAATLGIHGEHKFLDPTVEEESICNIPPQTGDLSDHGIITAAFSPAHQQISEFSQTGAMSLECVASSIDLLTAACEKIYPLSQQCLLKSVTKTLKKKQKENKLNLSSDRIEC